ncbi:1,2-phenylacetyl-CoA epoxidase subunit PaaC [Jatrophihabitans sp. DSM 45814]
MPDQDLDHDNAYGGLIESGESMEDHHWAFGTNFDDPLAGVAIETPAGVDGHDLAIYSLMLADDALIMSQRLAQWSTCAPELEEELALANIGLDLLGQARLLLARAAAADASVVPGLPAGSPVPSEDALAFFRDQTQFRNVRLTELENGDFALSMFRLAVFSIWRLEMFKRLTESKDNVLAAVAVKGVKEMTYHRDYAARWCVTLARGTAESRLRIERGIQAIWPFVAELFFDNAIEQRMAQSGVGVVSAELRSEFDLVVDQLVEAAELSSPRAKTATAIAGLAGRDGIHTEAMGALLAELQSVARAHPCGRW